MSTAQADWDDQMRGPNQRGQVMDAKERGEQLISQWRDRGWTNPIEQVTKAITEAEDAVRAGIVAWLRDEAWENHLGVALGARLNVADAIEAKEDQA